ncbi:MAG: helix-turn-helix domain-containing protein [candidate division WOR-3 bacterium]|nr:helix-turn-helix domain-containing protein [candidate division WOR-3 bacterium]
MSPEKLRELIAGGESEAVELKESFDREAVETAGAFANTRGGTIYVGVSRKGESLGREVGPETLSEWSNQVSQSTDPRVIPDVETRDVGGKTVVAMVIRESPLRPVSVKGRCYRRVGASNRVMTPAEISEMHLQSTGSSWDLQPAPGKTLQDMDPDKVRNYVRLANASGRKHIPEAESFERVLRKLELIKERRPTWAAVLLFGKRPQSPLMQAVVHCGLFKQESRVIDDRMIEGSLVDQVEEALKFIQKNTNVEFVITGKPARDEIWDYPLEALREALINAVCHRDYTVPSNTDIRIHDDRLEIWSPGGLPLGITLPELFKPHKSVLRNKGIASVLYDIGWIEKWGSGIDKIRRLCREAKRPEPDYEERQQSVIATFRKDVLKDDYLRRGGLNERQIAAVAYVKEHGSITNREYRKLTGVIVRTATRDLAGLSESGVIRQMGGAGRGTKYVLVSRETGHKQDKQDTKPDINRPQTRHKPDKGAAKGPKRTG